MFGGLNYCPHIIEFSSKSFEFSIFEEHIWERLKIMLENICDFMIHFEEHLSQGMKMMIHVNEAVCLEASFSSLLCRTFFERYKDEEDLVESGVETVSILAETVKAYIRVCQDCDWKNRLDWKPVRKALLTKCVYTLKRW